VEAESVATTVVARKRRKAWWHWGREEEGVGLVVVAQRRREVWWRWWQ
jgi:hypothetical protein